MDGLLQKSERFSEITSSLLKEKCHGNMTTFIVASEVHPIRKPALLKATNVSEREWNLQTT